MAKKMTNEELLKVLDMSEDEQKEWLLYNLPGFRPKPWTHTRSSDSPYFHCEYCKQKISGRGKDGECPKPTPWLMNDPSLADLAFRLRDEAKGSVGHKYWDDGKCLVAEYVTKVTSGIAFNQWFVDIAKPIHWIIAALVAKELKE